MIEYTDQEHAQRLLFEIARAGERMVEAFVAETGCLPSESEIVIDHTDLTRTVIFVRRRTP